MDGKMILQAMNGLDPKLVRQADIFWKQTVAPRPWRTALKAVAGAAAAFALAVGLYALAQLQSPRLQPLPGMAGQSPAPESAPPAESSISAAAENSPVPAPTPRVKDDRKLVFSLEPLEEMKPLLNLHRLLNSVRDNGISQLTLEEQAEVFGQSLKEYISWAPAGLEGSVYTDNRGQTLMVELDRWKLLEDGSMVAVALDLIPPTVWPGLVDLYKENANWEQVVGDPASGPVYGVWTQTTVLHPQKGDSQEVRLYHALFEGPNGTLCWLKGRQDDGVPDERELMDWMDLFFRQCLDARDLFREEAEAGEYYAAVGTSDPQGRTDYLLIVQGGTDYLLIGQGGTPSPAPGVTITSPREPEPEETAPASSRAEAEPPEHSALKTEAEQAALDLAFHEMAQEMAQEAAWDLVRQYLEMVRGNSQVPLAELYAENVRIYQTNWTGDALAVGFRVVRRPADPEDWEKLMIGNAKPGSGEKEGCVTNAVTLYGRLEGESWTLPANSWSSGIIRLEAAAGEPESQVLDVEWPVEGTVSLP